MNNWITLNNTTQLKEIVDSSYANPSVIFKHSTSCSLSSIAMMRLKSLGEMEKDYNLFYLDLLRNRSLSNKIADFFDVHHESPQIIVISKGEVLLDSSHLDISVSEIQEVLSEVRDTSASRR